MTGQIIKGNSLFVFLFLITSGCALYCYKCEDTPNSPDCSEAQECSSASPQYLEQFKGSLNIDASKPPKPVCFTSVVTYDGQQMSTRGCSVFGSKFTCELYRQTFERLNQNVTFCNTCEGDFCNIDSKIIKSQSQGGPSVVPQSGPLGPQSGPARVPNRRPDTVLSTKLPSIRPTSAEYFESTVGLVDHVTSRPSVAESISAAVSVYGLISVLCITFLSSLIL